MRQDFNSASTQTEQLNISDSEFEELCKSMMARYDNYTASHYYSIPAQLVAGDMSGSSEAMYQVPDCQDFYEGISSQTDLSLSFLDLSIASDLEEELQELEELEEEEEEEDMDFSGSDDCDGRQTSRRRRRDDVISVIDEEEDDDEEENIILQNVGTGQFMLDLLERIVPSSPPTDISTNSSSSSSSSSPSSNECTPTSSKGTDTSASSSSSNASNSSSSSSSHVRCLDFKSDSGSSPDGIDSIATSATTTTTTSSSFYNSSSGSSSSNNSSCNSGNNNSSGAAERKSKTKRAVPRMGTRLDLNQRPMLGILEGLVFPPPPPLSPSPDSFFQSPIPSRRHSHHHLHPLQQQQQQQPQHLYQDSCSPSPLSPSQLHVYQDLVFDLPGDNRPTDNFNNNNNSNKHNNHASNTAVINNNNNNIHRVLNDSGIQIHSEAFYHVLTPEHALQQQQQKQQQQQQHHHSDSLTTTTIVRKSGQGKVAFEARRSSHEEDIYENDYEVKTLLQDPRLSSQHHHHHHPHHPPPLPKRPAQVKFTPLGHGNSSGESAHASPVPPRHAGQGQISTGRSPSEDRKRQWSSRRGFAVETDKPKREGSLENAPAGRFKDSTNRKPGLNGASQSTPSSTERKVAVIGEDGVDVDRCEIYGRLAEIMYTNRANLPHTMMLQQKLFQQLQSRPKSQLVPNSENLRYNAIQQQQHLQQQQQQQQLQQQYDSHHYRTNQDCSQTRVYIIKRRQDGTRYITRRDKHQTKESKTVHRKNQSRGTIPKTTATTTTVTATAAEVPATVMPIFRARRNRERHSTPEPKPGRHQTLDPKMVRLDSFAALQNALQGKTASHPLQSQRQSRGHATSAAIVGKPLLSVITI